MEINFTWFNDEDVLEPPPSYEQIFFCNQENDQILEFEINRAEASHILRKNSPVEESEFDGYPRPKSPPEFYVKKNSIISDIPISSSPKPPPVPFEQLVPPHYHEFLSVFDEKASEHFSLKKPWDHAIDLKDTFVEQKARPYQLSSKEQEELDKWLDENLRKGYIRPSKSPQTSPFFYVPKPDSTGLRPCQDYRYLNSPFPSSPNSSTNSEVRNTSPKWIFAGVITIFKSRKETNGKPPSLQIDAALNQQL